MELSIIQSKIYELRGRRVMLDFDLASLYEVETRVLKQSIRRNIERFEGEDFMFELTRDEFHSLRSQFVTLNDEAESRRGKHSKYLPFAFTEMGVAMLSSILHSSTAIEINRGIMRAFVTIRQQLLSTATMSAELAQIKAKLQLLERSNEDTLEAVNDLSEDIGKDIENIYLAIGELSLKPAPAARRPMGYKFDVVDK